MMGLHQLSPSRSFLVAYGTDDDPVERDSLGTAIGCLAHAGRLSNPRANCQFKMNDPLRCYISETLTEPLRNLEIEGREVTAVPDREVVDWLEPVTRSAGATNFFRNEKKCGGAPRSHAQPWLPIRDCASQDLLCRKSALL